MFADPQSITYAGTSYSLVKVNQDQYSSEYRLRSSLTELSLRIRNTSYTDKKRGVSVDRHNVEIVHTTFPVAPSTLSVVKKAYLVFENQQGDDIANCAAWALSLCNLLAASSGAALTKLANFES